MKVKLLLLTLFLPLLIGCASQQQRAASKRIQSTCERLLGCTEEEVVLCLGAPQTIQDIGDLKIYLYHESYGVRSNSRGYARGLYNVWGTGSGETWEAFDKIEIYFKNGYVTSWKSSVQR